MIWGYVELMREITKIPVGRAGEKRGDVACFVVTKLLSNNFHAGKYQERGGFEEVRAPYTRLGIMDNCQT